MKKWLSWILVAVLTIGPIVGCANDGGSGEADPEKLSGKLTIWTFFAQVKDMAEQFEKKYPDVEVEVQVFPGDEYQTKLLTALQSGRNVPDVFDLERGYIGKFINSKYVADLSAMGGEDLVKDYVPYVQELGRDSKGTLRAVSDHSSPGGFWYIKDNAKKWLGTDDPEEISKMVDSWDKIIKLGKKVYEKSNGKVHLIDNYGSVNDVYAYNTKPWVKDGKLNIDPKWTEAYAVMEKMYANNVDGKLAFMSAGWGNALNDGSVVLTLAPAWAQFMIDNKDGKAADKYGVAKTPMGYYQGGTWRAIYEGSDNKELAYQFIKFIASEEWQQWNLENTGNLPGLLPVYEDNLKTFKSEVFGDQNILEPYYELVKSLPPVKADKYNEEILSKWRSISSEGIQNGQDINQVLKRFKSEVKNAFPELEVK